MSLDPRHIAAQGLGATARLVAVQGLWPSAGGFGGVVPASRRLIAAQADGLIDEDDALLLIAISCAAGAAILQ